MRNKKRGKLLQFRIPDPDPLDGYREPPNGVTMEDTGYPPCLTCPEFSDCETLCKAGRAAELRLKAEEA